MENNVNILVIGNGFDLYHGLKTSYFDFVEYTMRPISNNQMEQIRKNNPLIWYFQQVANANDGWIDCEETINDVITSLKKFFDILVNSKRTTFKASDLSKRENTIIDAFKTIFTKQVSYNGVTLLGQWVNGFQELDKPKVLKELKKYLDEVIILLEYYLSECTNNLITCKVSQQINSIAPIYTINFNYTDTCTQLYDINSDDVFYIHGKLNSTPNNMTFGISDETTEELDFVYFHKYFQKIQKRTGVLDTTPFYQNNHCVTTHFFGHSLGTTDKETITAIERLCNEMIVYYVDQFDYEQKVVNLLHLFGKEDVVNKIEHKKIKFVQILPQN